MRHDMRNLAATVAALLSVRPPAGAEAGPIPQIVAHLGPVQRLAMVVIDAFGLATWDYARDHCPTVNALAADCWLTIRSVLPAITPVNFATMVTGASPQSHSIRARTDRLELETLFHVLQSEGRSAAAVGRALSTVGILLAPFAELRGVAESNEDGEVLDLGLRILGENEPDYLLLQFLAVDSASHRHGPFTRDNAQAVAETDARLRVLISQLALQDYGLLLLADHGQHTASPEKQRPGHLGTHDGSVEEDVQVPLIWASPAQLRGMQQKW
jgi:predicted AlkP superfamily pyrophosphatase or phosphodiesterase